MIFLNIYIMSKIKLVNNDNYEISIDSELIKKYEYLMSKYDQNSEKINLEDINESILKVLVKYLQKYGKCEESKLPEELKSSNLKEELNDWDVKFLEELTFEQTFNLINATILLNIPHLHDLACIKIAAFMKDKQPDDVNKEFTIECQLTADEAKNLGLEVEDS